MRVRLAWAFEREAAVPRERPLNRCRPGRAKRGPVVRSRHRVRADFRSGEGGCVSRSRGENLQGHPTCRQAIVGGVGLGVCLSSPAPTAGRTGAQQACRHCASPVGCRSPRQVSRALTRHSGLGRKDAPARPERSGGAEPGWRRVGARKRVFFN